MSDINNEFGLTDKICFTVTDSGSNFIKAFKHFGIDNEEAISIDPKETDDMEYHELDNILHPPVTDEDDDQIVYKLPQHWKCAFHALNLVAATDCQKIDGMLKRVSVQTFAKLTALWNKQNRSVAASEKILTALGSLLITPGETRWNSMYDAMAKVNNFLTSPATETEFDKLCDDMDILRLQPAQKTFVSEYVVVMKPVCCGLDVLQGDKDVGLGHLLPTLTIMKNELNKMRDKEPPLTLCQPLVQLLLNGIEKRFEHIFNSSEAQLAAVVHPKFKLYWVDDEDEKRKLTDILKRRAQSVTPELAIQSVNAVDACTCSASTDILTTGSTDFFAALTAKRLRCTTETDNSVTDEIHKYLSDTSSELSSLTVYPRIRKLYISTNTGLPASAAVERLFSLGGRVFSPLRSRLSSEHFKMMVFLRLAKW